MILLFLLLFQKFSRLNILQFMNIRTQKRQKLRARLDNIDNFLVSYLGNENSQLQEGSNAFF